MPYRELSQQRGKVPPPQLFTSGRQRWQRSVETDASTSRGRFSGLSLIFSALSPLPCLSSCAQPSRLSLYSGLTLPDVTMARSSRAGELKARHVAKTHLEVPQTNGDVKTSGKRPVGKEDRNTEVSKAVALSLVDYGLILSLVFGGCCSSVRSSSVVTRATRVERCAT